MPSPWDHVLASRLRRSSLTWSGGTLRWLPGSKEEQQYDISEADDGSEASTVRCSVLVAPGKQAEEQQYEISAADNGSEMSSTMRPT